jgi:hypothetical protein
MCLELDLNFGVTAPHHQFPENFPETGTSMQLVGKISGFQQLAVVIG